MNGFPYAFFGIIPDGETEQVLMKRSGDSYDVQWATIDSGLFGENYALVKANSADPLVNGASLLAAYTAAKALTPYGAALSSTNRYTILMGDGIYDTAAQFEIDTQFIDFKSLSGNKVTFTQNINISADNVKVGDFDCAGFGFTVGSDLPNVILNNIITNETNAFGGGSIFSSTATNCVGGNNSFGGGGLFSGTATDCTGGNNSFGGNAIFSGTATNCTGGNNCFGGNIGTFSGTATDCVGGDNSFGGTFSGTATNCTGGNNCFGGNIGIFSGTAINCTGGAYSFGGGDIDVTGGNTFSGTATNCMGGIGSFGGKGGIFSGTATDCVGGDNSFGSTFSGTAINCTGGNNCFGDNSLVSGILINCVGTNSFCSDNVDIQDAKLLFCWNKSATFPTPTGTGKIYFSVDDSI